MKNFTYQLPIRIYFGQNCAEQHLADELKKYGPNIMLAYGKGSVKTNGIYDQMVSILNACGKHIIEFGGIPSNPTYAKVQEGIRLYKENNVDLILAVGGGSVVDCVKIVTAGVFIEEDLWETEVEQHIIPEKMGKYGVVLTLSGAGAEMDRLGAATYEEKNEKKTLTGSYAEFVMIDPKYQASLPLSRFMPGVYDSLSHCMETYFGKGLIVSDYMNEGLMKDIVLNMKKLISGEDTMEVRSNLMWDSSLIQTFLFQIGKAGDFQVHGVENALGAYSHGTHGCQLAVLQPSYYRLVYSYDIPKFARFAREIMGVEEADDETAAVKGIDALEQLIADAGLKSTFHELGYELSEQTAREVSQKCGLSRNGVHQLSRDELCAWLLSRK